MKNAKSFRVHIKHSCVVALGILLISVVEVYADARSPETAPSVDVSGAVLSADTYVHSKLNLAKCYLAWVSLLRLGDDPARKWVTAWYPDGGNPEDKSKCVIVSVEIRDAKEVIERIVDPVGYGDLGNIHRAIKFESALKRAYAFSKEKDDFAHHYIYRAGLGRIGDSKDVFWVFCWWPDIHPKATDSWPIVAVRMNGECEIVDKPVTWLARKKLYLPPRERVDPPLGVENK